ncbi:MAG: hypothetical protein NTZ05_18465 [Chloroflexi bacterium]|nr:hypothetical protein [Chloroflexota bacterium]
MAFSTARWMAGGAAAAVIAAAAGAELPSRPVAAQPAAAAISSLCSQMPNLLAAVDWSQKTWPPERFGISAATASKLAYYRLMVAADTTWCAISNTQDQADSVLNTMQWHFGNASVELRDYQAAARSGAPAATATPVSATPAAPTATPVPGAPATPTAPATPAPPPFTGTRLPLVKDAQPGAPAAVLTNVRIGSNAGFDRVVFEFRNARPGYRIEYVQPPIKYDASGMTADIAGNAFLRVRLTPASGFDQAAGQLAYTGPAEFALSMHSLREAEQTGDFEAVLTWVLGLQQTTDFRVLELEGPTRLVIDTAHPPR